MDLHPYDNVERCFRHTDPARGEGRAVVARLLGLAELPVGELLYDLSCFSGGIGVLDNFAITLSTDPTLWSTVAGFLQARPLEEAVADSSWAGELIWLLTDEEKKVSIRPAAVRFINLHRREFQTVCGASSRILFGYESNVNDWVTLWGDDTQMNYLGYSQG